MYIHTYVTCVYIYIYIERERDKKKNPIVGGLAGLGALDAEALVHEEAAAVVLAVVLSLCLIDYK